MAEEMKVKNKYEDGKNYIIIEILSVSNSI